MNASVIALLLIAVLIVAAFALMIIRAKRADENNFEKSIADSWGKINPRLFLVQDLEKIREFSEAEQDASPEGSSDSIDAITAKDIDLDLVFSQIAGSVMSSPGAEVLYAWLRHPLLRESLLKHRIELQECLASDEEGRKKMQRALYEIGFLKGSSFFHDLKELQSAGLIGTGKFIFLSAATAAALILLFFRPLIAVIVLIPLIAFNFHIHMSMKKSSKEPLRGIDALISLINGAGELSALMTKEAFSEEKAEMEECLQVLSPFKRGAFLVTSKGSVGDGLFDAVMEYVKLLFHIDLIRYDRMIGAAKAHEAEIRRLFYVIGTIDASCASASYMEALPVSCRPEFTDRKVLEVREMGHPLLSDPVRNSIAADRPVLLTGSNASGKSTFLKNTALCAILAQSAGCVPAASYTAPFFRVFSSMALTDHLMQGESYFIVEIRSLKRIFDAASEEGPPVLGFVDEVLRGTNTIERIAASAQVLKTLGTKNALLFAATHDIELSQLLEDSFTNMHFEESMEDGDLRFDYKLREGRAVSGNAIALLKKEGFPDEMTSASGKMAETYEKEGIWKLL